MRPGVFLGLPLPRRLYRPGCCPTFQERACRFRAGRDHHLRRGLRSWVTGSGKRSDEFFPLCEFKDYDTPAVGISCYSRGAGRNVKVPLRCPAVMPGEGYEGEYRFSLPASGSRSVLPSPVPRSRGSSCQLCQVLRQVVIFLRSVNFQKCRQLDRTNFQ